MLRDYQKQRILTLLSPEDDLLGSGWNIVQSKTAIGSGGLYGKGWLNGTQSQLDFFLLYLTLFNYLWHNKEFIIF